MSFSIESATYGRDQKGIKVLVNEIEAKMNNVIKGMETTSADFKNIESTIKKYWVGKDADNFVKALKEGNKKNVNAIKSIRGKFISEFAADEKAFAKFQESNKII